MNNERSLSFSFFFLPCPTRKAPAWMGRQSKREVEANKEEEKFNTLSVSHTLCPLSLAYMIFFL
jgi:hypothetical protein